MSFSRAAALFLLLVCPGCGGGKPDVQGDRSVDESTNDEPAAVDLKLVIVGMEASDDRALGEAIARLWSTEEGGSVKVDYRACDALQSLSPDDAQAALSADAVIYPVGMLGEFAERQGIVEIPADVLRDRTFDRRAIFDFTGKQAATWGKKPYGFPLGSPQFALYYRGDVFERLGLAPPKTWEEYRAVAEKLSQESPPLAALEPLAPGWASQTLLARAAPYAKHSSQYSTLFNYTTMEPLVAGPPFVKALEELAAVAKLSGDPARRTPHEIRDAFWQGKAGMALTWPTGAMPSGAKVEGDDASASNAAIAVAFAELPGASSAYNIRSGQWEDKPASESKTTPLVGIAGRMGSVTRKSKHAEAAFRLLASISGAQWSGQLAPLCRDATLYRPTHAAAAAKWVEPGTPLAAANQYAELAERMQSGSTWLSSPALPGRAEYLTALDEAVWSVVERGESPQAALDVAAGKWREITERLGVEKQRQAYERSLGLEP